MSRTLYFEVPMFGKSRIESLIINDLGCPCYKVVGKDKYFSDNEKLLIFMTKKVAIVNILCSDEDKDDVELDVRKAFYGDDAFR